MSKQLQALSGHGQLAIVRVRCWLVCARDVQRGQGLVEYALILAFIAIMVIVALRFLQPTISNTLNRVSSNL